MWILSLSVTHNAVVKVVHPLLSSQYLTHQRSVEERSSFLQFLTSISLFLRVSRSAGLWGGCTCFGCSFSSQSPSVPDQPSGDKCLNIEAVEGLWESCGLRSLYSYESAWLLPPESLEFHCLHANTCSVKHVSHSGFYLFILFYSFFEMMQLQVRFTDKIVLSA